ncbi:MAG: hypothetical protein FIA92_08750 [Chloroflexi bacterium]|nr:hypothetical protein [Chloroflexota bacterium]
MNRGRRPRWGKLAGILSCVMVLGACTPEGTPRTPPPLGLANQTGLTVTLAVNGTPVASYPPGGLADPIDPSLLPPLPWRISVSPPSVDGHLVEDTIDASSGDGGSVGWMSTCGTLIVWWGDWHESLPPLPSPLQSTDCR